MVFKQLESSDYAVRRFKVYKSWFFNNYDSASGIYSMQGISSSAFPIQYWQASDDVNSNGKYKKSVYSSIKHLYYNDNPFYNFHYQYGFETASMGEVISVITIPARYIGEKINPSSVEMNGNSASFSCKLYDDGYGNLYDNAYSSSYVLNQVEPVGNVLYEHGLITITTQTSSYQNTFYEKSGSWDVAFKSEHTIYENEWVCTARAGEFNGSTNPSIRDNWDTGSEYYRSFVTSSIFSPYITTIGLYDSNLQLVAVARLAAPLKKPTDFDISFAVKIDM